MRRRRLSLALAAVVVLLAALAAGCGGDGDDAATSEFELRIGNLIPFTGDLSSFGEPIDQAAKLAVEVINEAIEEQGLEGVSVSIVASEDDQTDATAGVEAATKLVQTDNVDVIMGALASSVTIPVAQSVSIPEGVLQISPASTSPAISDLEDNGLVWRTPPSDALQGRVLAQALAEEFGADATINTGTRNDAYGTALIEAFEAAWREGGGTIGQSVRWNPEATTFDTEAQQLASGNPDGWVIIDFPETWAKFGPALVRAGGWDPSRTFTADGLRDSSLPADVGAPATEGMRGTAPSSEGAPAGEAFAALWEERAGGIQRQTFDAQAFDAVMVVFLAALQAGSSDPDAIKEELPSVSGPGGEQVTFEDLPRAIELILDGEEIDYEGASGPINFDANGDPGAAIYEVWQFKDGDVVTLRSFEFE